ncbi:MULTISPECIES: aspartate-alanine antiporter [unclassified Achromobacter]|uniref:aspartate-alanine antiporter n=1 Tax=unclassified Achromobacter TaxID=2626865 RepID=UPI000B514E29|nr:MULTISPECIES: aspartate-alanine antiporter [unclassified Achromobacter]OWT68941.1 aspartate-alanine antiporter [Achromobacter sp. HZ28]OWT78496.1 aspartate-alanine antiporter [Achromobacter sp. HZ34]
MEWLFGTLRRYPELAIFLTLGVGYWIGAKKIKGFSLGAVTGTLLVGVLVGQLDIQIAPVVKQVFFLLFLFGLGYGVGPQFFRGMKSDGLPQVLFAVVLCVICLLASWGTAVAFGFDAGTGAGLLAGAQTISAVMGVATDTINGLTRIDEATRKHWIDSIPVAYAVCYIFGTIGSAWLLASVGPKLMRVDLVKVCQEYEAQMSGGQDSLELSGYRKFIARVYRLDQADLIGKTVADLEARFGDDRVFVERIRRDGGVVDAVPTTVLQAGDVLGVAGRHDVLVLQAAGKIGPEVEDHELINLPAELIEVVLTNKKLAGKTLREISLMPEASLGRGVFLRKVVRGGHEMPVNWGLKLDRGDHLFIVGAKRDVERVVDKLGYADRQTAQTDMVFVGFGIVIGGLLGSLVLTVSGIPVTLSTSGGSLIAGLVFGYLRSVHPTFGRVPEPVHWFLTSVGLTTFVAVVGIASGPGFVEGFRQLGLKLFLAGIVATSVPMLIGVPLARYVFKFHPAIALGVCAGARTTTAAIGQITESAKSQVPALGYTIPYAIGNTLLIIWGIVIVLLMA